MSKPRIILTVGIALAIAIVAIGYMLHDRADQKLQSLEQQCAQATKDRFGGVLLDEQGRPVPCTYEAITRHSFWRDEAAGEGRIPPLARTQITYLDQLEAALVKADAAGNVEDAQRFADAIRAERAISRPPPGFTLEGRVRHSVEIDGYVYEVEVPEGTTIEQARARVQAMTSEQRRPSASVAAIHSQIMEAGDSRKRFHEDNVFGAAFLVLFLSALPAFFLEFIPWLWRFLLARIREVSDAIAGRSKP